MTSQDVKDLVFCEGAGHASQSDFVAMICSNNIQVIKSRLMVFWNVVFTDGWNVTDGEAVMKVKDKQGINVGQVILMEKQLVSIGIIRSDYVVADIRSRIWKLRRVIYCHRRSRHG